MDCRGRSLSACKLEFSAEESTDHFVRVAVAANTSDTVQFAISVDLQGNAYTVQLETKIHAKGLGPSPCL